jgi:LmbE family N-acetylglucosaminyl deacetylase
MHPFTLDPAKMRRVLCIGAHCDDVEIGAGATLIAWSQRCPGVRFDWVLFSGDDQREAESRAAAARIHVGGDYSVRVLRFRGSYFPAEYGAIKDVMEALRDGPEPDLVLTHRLEDRHQDHRVLAELTWGTFRRHQILEYEIPKYEGDLGQPNVYVPLDETHVTAKLALLMECFPSQRHRAWFTEDLFRGHLRLRGIECNAPSGFAEAFYARKLTVD